MAAAANDNAKNVIYASFGRSAGIVSSAVGAVEPEEQQLEDYASQDKEGLKLVSESLSGLHDVVYQTLATLQSRSLLDQYIMYDQKRVQLENARESGSAVMLPPMVGTEADMIGAGGEESVLLRAFGSLGETIKAFAEQMQELIDALEEKSKCPPGGDVLPDIDIDRRRGRGRPRPAAAPAERPSPPSPAHDSKGRLRRGWRPVMGRDGKVRYVQTLGSRKPPTARRSATSNLLSRSLGTIGSGIVRGGMIGAPLALGAGLMAAGGMVRNAVNIGGNLLNRAFTSASNFVSSSVGAIAPAISGFGGFGGGSTGGGGATGSWDVDTSRSNIALSRITTRSGLSAEVASIFAPNFQGFINDLEATGYQIRDIGGYSDRDVVGRPGVKSMHAAGAAIDINPRQNPYGRARITDMPVETVDQLAARWGLGWGYRWSSISDAMHFSIARSERGSVDINPNSGVGMAAIRPNTELAGQPTTASPPPRESSGRRQPPAIDPRWLYAFNRLAPPARAARTVVTFPFTNPLPPRAAPGLSPITLLPSPQRTNPREEYSLYFR